MCQSVFNCEGSGDLTVVAGDTVVVGAEPEETLAILEDRPHGIVCQAGLGAFASTPGRSPGLAPLPSRACVAALAGRSIDAFTRFAAPSSIGDAAGSVVAEALTVVQSRAVAVGAEPQIPLAILEQRAYPIGCQSILGRQRHEPLSIVLAHAPDFGSEPQIPVPVFEHGDNPVGRQSILGRKVGKALSIVPTHPPLGAKPQVALSIFEDGSDSIGRQSIPGREIRKTLPIVPAHPPFGAKPQVALSILQNRVHVCPGQSVPGAIGAPVPPSGFGCQAFTRVQPSLLRRRQGDLPLLYQLQYLLRDAPLYILHFAQAHRPQKFHFLGDEGPHPSRHVAQHLVLQLIRRPLERNDQILLIHLAHQGLDLPIRQPGNILENEPERDLFFGHYRLFLSASSATLWRSPAEQKDSR